MTDHLHTPASVSSNDAAALHPPIAVQSRGIGQPPRASPTSRLAGGALTFVVIAGLGLACMIVPTYLQSVGGASGKPPIAAPLFPLLRESIEHMTWVPIVALAALGLLAGLLTRLPPPLIALATITAFPIAMLAEMIADPTSHNLFPFECAMYLMLAVPPLLMAFAGRWLRRRSIVFGRAA